MKTCVRQKMFANGNQVRGGPRILTDSVGKETGKKYWQIMIKHELT